MLVSLMAMDANAVHAVHGPVPLRLRTVGQIFVIMLLYEFSANLGICNVVETPTASGLSADLAKKKTDQYIRCCNRVRDSTTHAFL